MNNKCTFTVWSGWLESSALMYILARPLNVQGCGTRLATGCIRFLKEVRVNCRPVYVVMYSISTRYAAYMGNGVCRLQKFAQCMRKPTACLCFTSLKGGIDRSRVPDARIATRLSSGNMCRIAPVSWWTVISAAIGGREQYCSMAG
jgi:hypothetical protein